MTDKDYMRKYRESHREERRKYDAINHLHQLAQQREWRRNHREKVAAQRKKHRERYRESLDTKRKEYYLSNLEREREKRRVWVQQNLPLVREKWEKWHRMNPEKVRIADQKYEHKRRGLPIDVVLNDWFPDCHLHHLGEGLGIHIPSTLHTSISHSLIRDFNMEKINHEALNWAVQEAEKG